MLCSGSSPAQAAIALQPADVAVVVGAEQVDAAVEAALALVEVVGGVGGEVGQLAVGPDQHPVLVVAEVGGAQPERAVGVEDVALLARAARARRPTAAGSSCRLRSENQTSKWVPNRSSWSCCSLELQLVARPRGTRPAARRRAASRMPGSLGDDLLRRCRAMYSPW